MLVSGQLVFHESDRQRVKYLMRITGKLGDNYRAKYIFTEVGITNEFILPENSFIPASEVYKAEWTLNHKQIPLYKLINHILTER